MAKIGDTVRYLNSVGGGKIVRIEGNIAYVDEDGFETPVLLKECVVINVANDITKATEPPVVSSKPAEPSKEVKTEPVLPVVETPDGDKMNIVLGFEPDDILKLSEVNIYAYLVNDSNYYLYFTYSSSPDGIDWTVRYAGIIEPNIQLLLEKLNRDNINDLDRIAVQIIAFKKDKPFALKRPMSIDFKFDATKFFRRHCFKPDDYFDTDVIAVHLVTDDVPYDPLAARKSRENLKENAFKPKKIDLQTRKKVVKRKKSDIKSHDKIVVDLHIEELLDSSAGMSNADILNYQIDEFRKVMDSNLKNKGQKIIFIHGKGEGVLRNALLKELNHRYKNHDIQDASFQEFGFGATQVTIR